MKAADVVSVYFGRAGKRWGNNGHRAVALGLHSIKTPQREAILSSRFEEVEFTGPNSWFLREEDGRQIRAAMERQFEIIDMDGGTEANSIGFEEFEFEVAADALKPEIVEALARHDEMVFNNNIKTIYYPEYKHPLGLRGFNNPRFNDFLPFSKFNRPFGKQENPFAFLFNKKNNPLKPLAARPELPRAENENPFNLYNNSEPLIEKFGREFGRGLADKLLEGVRALSAAEPVEKEIPKAGQEREAKAGDGEKGEDPLINNFFKLIGLNINKK